VGLRPFFAPQDWKKPLTRRIEMALPKAVQDIIENKDHTEGKMTAAIEQQTSKVPSVVYLNLAFASIALSVGIAASTRKAEWANFVGLWAPAFMLIGIYNKLVKQQQTAQ
jgi:hypothetical protein